MYHAWQGQALVQCAADRVASAGITKCCGFKYAGLRQRWCMLLDTCDDEENAVVAHIEVLEGEGQADGVEAQLLQAPHDGVKVLGQAVIALCQVPWTCQACIEAIPAPKVTTE